MVKQFTTVKYSRCWHHNTYKTSFRHFETKRSSKWLEMRKSRSRGRGLTNEVKKYKIRSKPQEDPRGLTGTILNLRNLRKRLTELSLQSCAFINETAFKLCLVPLYRGESGKVVVAPWNRLIAHFAFLVLWCVRTATPTYAKGGLWGLQPPLWMPVLH